MTEFEASLHSGVRQTTAPKKAACTTPPLFRCAASGVVLLVSILVFIVPLLFLPGTAFAAQWPLDSSRLSASLGYHQTYVRQGTTYVHSGIDIKGSSGAGIAAPCAGTVSFTGQVPSGDSGLKATEPESGETMTAVSVKMEDGRTVTLMPFAGVNVKRGETVSEGQALGTLAAKGDRSSRAVHLHMGLKRNGVYYDPMTLFDFASSSEQEAASAAAAATGTAPLAAAEPSVQPATSAGAAGSVSDSAAGTAGESAASQSVEAVEPAASEEASFGSISSGEVAWQPSVTEDAGILSALQSRVAALGYACRAQLLMLEENLGHLAAVTGVPLAVWQFGCIAGVALAVVALITMGVVLFVKIRKHRQGQSQEATFAQGGAQA